MLCGSRQGCEVALSTLLTWEGEPFAALVGMSAWLPLDNWALVVATGDYSRLHEDGDEFHDIEAFWEKDHEDDEDFDWRTKAVKAIRFELFLQKKKGQVFKQVPVCMGQSRKDRIAGLGIQAKRFLDIVGANFQMSEFESLSSVHGCSREC